MEDQIRKSKTDRLNQTHDKVMERISDNNIVNTTTFNETESYFIQYNGNVLSQHENFVLSNAELIIPFISKLLKSIISLVDLSKLFKFATLP